MIESKFEYNYYCNRFIWFILLVYLAFMGFLGLASINYIHENKNQFMDEIPAYIVPDKLEIMAWYDPKIDEEYFKKRRYQLIMEYYKKSIRKLAKKASTDPFDSAVGMEMLIEHLKFMRDYYANGYNVWAMEVEGHPSRQEGIEMALTEYKLMNSEGYGDDDLVYNYFESYINTDYGTEIKLPNYNKPLNGLTKDEAFEKLREEALYHKKMFYKILEQEFDIWWD